MRLFTLTATFLLLTFIATSQTKSPKYFPSGFQISTFFGYSDNYGIIRDYVPQTSSWEFRDVNQYGRHLGVRIANTFYKYRGERYQAGFTINWVRFGLNLSEQPGNKFVGVNLCPMNAGFTNAFLFKNSGWGVEMQVDGGFSVISRPFELGRMAVGGAFGTSILLRNNFFSVGLNFGRITGEKLSYTDEYRGGESVSATSLMMTFNI